MTPELWQRVKQVAAAALELSPELRREHVAAASAGDPVLEREAVSLLTATAQASTLWETPAIGNAAAALSAPTAARPASALAGSRIGPYRLVREIGHGGMGTVFLAERADDEYRQSVAVKVAHDARSAMALERFRDERQILATLNHPNIARLMDGGTTEDGVPYLVMEFVEGVPIDEYCSAEGLGVTDRLELFGRVCAAVDFAHRNLVVHRDLKPRNILVAADGPKLLDFGIATLLDPERDRTPVDRPGTETAPRMLTLEYASPEQLRGGPITTATDVYALGVLLYRLLANRSPYRLTSEDTRELAVAVCEQELVPPSRSVGGDRRLRDRLRGDLDAIALKALDKDPAARYASAAQLAEDLERYRQRRPVAARPASVSYRAGRFLARHTLSVSAAALVLVSLAGGLAATVAQVRETDRQRARAERHFDEVRGLASSLIFEVHDGIQNLPGAIPTRQLVVKRALDYFDRLAVEERGNPEIQRELAAAYDKLGGVLGRPYAANLGDSDAALSSYRKALAIREQIVGVYPTREARLDLWSSYLNVGGLLAETADTAGGLAFQGKASELVSTLLAADSQDAELLRASARTAVARAHTMEQAGQIADALAAARHALEVDQQLLSRDSSDDTLRSDVAADYGRVGITLLKLGDREGALVHLRQRLPLSQQLTAKQPSNVSFRRNLSTAHLQLGQALARGADLPDATRELRTALALREGLQTEDPENRQAGIDVMFARLELAQVLGRVGEPTQAAAHLRSAIQACEGFVAADDDYVFFRLSLATALERLAENLLARRQPHEAAPLVRRAIEILQAAATADPTDARVRFELALAYEAAGDVAASGLRFAAESDDAGQNGSAAWWYRRSVTAMEELHAAGRLAGGTLNGREAERLAEVRQKLRAWSPEPGARSPTF